ncbi:FadR family transcriptional regulator [Labilibaculum sp. DW002]|uniref:FadR family transcriptional regulator n=1 Tax=Paralabilibaculum antarcticum TaxID=2912572 RepID=A0ABT5VU31_9BACT|nr:MULTISPECIES: FadR/GntR family transcriptional regulator [unclassified Labilibaculum]MBI9058133.1 FadR family transcriptional regulator [Labilibaculum sp.]MDE5418801.1 FadR family transcriptional regulator [Labilibaculum sp. DW002]
MEILDSFKAIEVESPVDKIIRQIRDLIIAGYLNPGDKLPSERKLSEKFSIGRTHIRNAIKKLEFYGILATNPQSGVIVKGADMAAMQGLITNVMKIESPDFYSLVETRCHLEITSVQNAALRRTEEDLIKLDKAHKAFEEKVKNNLPAENEDFIFHLKIAEASHNSVSKTLMLIVLPDILEIYRRENVCANEGFKKSLVEHENIMSAIKNGDPDLASKYMKEHLNDVLEFSRKKLNL